MEKFFLVKVPKDSADYFINNAGCLRFSTQEGRLSSLVEPMEIGEYLENTKHDIIGESVLNNEKIIIVRNKYAESLSNGRICNRNGTGSYCPICGDVSKCTEGGSQQK